MRLFLCCALFPIVALQVHAEGSSSKTQANVMVEISFTAAREHSDPFNQVALDVAFTDPKGQIVRVPAFWAGKNVWKVRFASPIVGRYPYLTDASDKTDSGLHGVSGAVEIAPYTGTNPLYVHGPIRVAADKRHFEHADGTPFFWLGDTWWMGLCNRLHWPDEVKTLAADRKAKGFNVIQIVAGLYPDMFPFDPRGANEAGFPWEKDYKAIRPEYFDKADERLRYLVDEGFTPCIVGAWGYFMPWMGVDKMKAHWRYLIARYGALPVVWCAAGEANLPWYQAKGFPYDDRAQVKQWTEVMKYIKQSDPYHRPLTIHPTGIGRLSARHATDDPNLLDFDLLQTPHANREGVPATITTVRESYADTPKMPVIDGEASYENLMGSIKTEFTRRMFWICMTNGACGHTYGANGIWQCNRKGQPHGPSPTAGSPPTGYGATPWDEAMNYPGSKQVGLGKKFFEQFPWQKFEPHPQWAAYLSKPVLSFEGAEWIWFPEGDPSQDAPAEKRYFRRSFEIMQGKNVKSARMRVSADDRFAAFVNGKSLGTSPDGQYAWKTGKQFDDLGPLLKAGKNAIAIMGENLPAPSNNPAGLIAKLEIHYDNDETQTIVSDAQWSTSSELQEKWETVDFVDTKWEKAVVAAHFGAEPWGKLSTQTNDPIFGPQCTGIGGQIRVIYVPDPQAVELRELGKHAAWNASWFDPTTGETKELPKVQANDTGSATLAPPKVDHDWVLVLKHL